MKKICTVLAFVLLFATFCTISVSAAPVPRPNMTSGNKICVFNLETGDTPMAMDADVKIPATVTAKIMTAIVVSETFSDLGEKVSVPAEASMDAYVGAFGLISAPRLGLTVGKEYSIKDLLSALLVSSSNDAGVTLAYHAGGGSLDKFVGMMNEKAKALGAKNTVYKNCVGLEDGSETTAYDSAIIAAEFSKKSVLIDISSAGRAATSEMGNLHNKNYLTSDFLIKGLKLSSVRGICAGQSNENGNYCAIAYYASNDLSYIICVMGASGEKRNVQAGTRWFDEENAYNDIHKIVPWLKESFEIRNIISPESEEFSFSIPVKNSGKKSSVMTVPTDTVRVLTDITAEKVVYVTEPVFYQKSFNAPVKPGETVGEVTIYKNGVAIATVPLATKEGAERSELLFILSKFKAFMKSDTVLWAIKGIIILAIAFVGISLARFAFRIFKKYRNGMTKDYYPPAD